MVDDQERPLGGSSPDPEERAFTGGVDMPPEQPDQPAGGNRELLRDEEEEASKPAEAPPAEDNPHGDYPSLPGYGG
ncbi:MAG: hypothetical protein M3N39_10345 [Pseudomonadota bacterium]|nr:hypothetical protein [Pseudomonadota bacterium]